MPKPTRRIMRRFKLDEISLVDTPAQEPARMTLLKRQVTKAVGSKKFFMKDFAFVEDETDPTTWKWRLTDKPNGKPTPARVSSAIKAFEAQRYAIPDDALESVLDKLREAWMKAYPSKAEGDMPPSLQDEPIVDPADDAAGEEDPEGEDTKQEPPFSEEGEGDESGEGDPAEDAPTDEDNAEADKEENEDEEDEMVGKILKGYIDTSDGAKTFGEVVAICRQQDEHWEMLDKAWPVISALDQSIRSIVADTEIDSTAKHTMLRSSVEGFLAAIKEVMPEVEEVLEKVLEKAESLQRKKGARKMGKSTDTLEKRFEELEKKFQASEKAREEAVAKAKELEAIAALTADEKEFYDKAKGDAKGKFLAMSKADRVKAIKKALEDDETIEIDGQTFSKSSTDPAMFAFLKSQVARTEALEKKLNEEREARENAEVAKQARDEFPNLPGTDEEKVALLKSIRALPKEQQDVMLKFVKTADSTATLALQRLGTSGAHNISLSVSKAAESDEFMAKVSEIRKRDNCSRTDAMRKARKEYPREYAKWNGNGAAH